MRLIFIPGTPAPQGSMRGYIVKDRVNMVSDNPKTVPWRHAIAAEVRAEIGNVVLYPKPLPVSLSLEFIMPRRKAEPVRVTRPHTRKPDLDKLIRATLDALTGLVYDDDSQVNCFDRIEKRPAEIGEKPGLWITIEGVG